MYFASRTEAGQKLAEELKQYDYMDSVVLALSDGGVVVGAQIAANIHCPLMLLLTGDIKLPGETSVLGVVDQNGGFSYNDLFSTGELEELHSEYHTFIEQEKQMQWHSLNRLLSQGGFVKPEILKRRAVILVSDGFTNGMSLVAAAAYLKSIEVSKIIVATPLATVGAVDKMHILADELHVISVIEDTFAIDHYYEINDVPDQSDILRILDEAITKWQ